MQWAPYFARDIVDDQTAHTSCGCTLAMCAAAAAASASPSAESGTSKLLPQNAPALTWICEAPGQLARGCRETAPCRTSIKRRADISESGVERTKRLASIDRLGDASSDRSRRVRRAVKREPQGSHARTVLRAAPLMGWEWRVFVPRDDAHTALACAASRKRTDLYLPFRGGMAKRGRLGGGHLGGQTRDGVADDGSSAGRRKASRRRSLRGCSSLPATRSRGAARSPR